MKPVLEVLLIAWDLVVAMRDYLIPALIANLLAAAAYMCPWGPDPELRSLRVGIIATATTYDLLLLAVAAILGFMLLHCLKCRD
ncbi:MAG: hypothetical protein KGJ93_02350 [Patescibacteria group bacterium]|nr:hypothetical protein [Patescibacteria group bacterium]